MELKLFLSETEPSAATILLDYIQDAVEVEWGKVNQLVVGDVVFKSESSICRFLARKFQRFGLYGIDGALVNTEVDHWLDFITNLNKNWTPAIEYLDRALKSEFLVGKSLTIADAVVWQTLHLSSTWRKYRAKGTTPANVTSYYERLSSHPAFQTIMNKCPDLTADSKPEMKKNTDVGKFVKLPGADVGQVTIRFPPEASGYLHIGHGKAALLNQYYQEKFNGYLIMRFDDTNPAKENAEFEKIILEDLEIMGVKYDHLSHTSDFFDQLLDYCMDLIKMGKAYVDDTDADTMKKQREERVDSKCRENSVGKNLEMWEEMKKGSTVGVNCCVRAKISMALDNGCMRDPTIYRCKDEMHVRTGDKYKVYPTYDFACPIVDSLERVTHALRTTEYQDRDEQYAWILDSLGLYKPQIYGYSRLNLQNTVLSKRKLTWIVDNGYVDGWDDPRLPTIRGIMRHGLTVEGLKQFIASQGSSRSVVVMEWDKIWAFNKKVIDPVAPRYVALQREGLVTVQMEGVKEEKTSVAKHPKNLDIGDRDLWYSCQVFIDGADAELLSEGEVVTFLNWGNVIISKVERNTDGRVTLCKGVLDLENKDFKNTQKVTWLPDTTQAPLTPTVCVTYDHIISKGVLNKDEDFKQYINKSSKKEEAMLGDPSLAQLKKGDIIQLLRRGFYICDAPYEPVSINIGKCCPCVLIFIPDGHQKEKPTSGSKMKNSESKSSPKKNPNTTAAPETGVSTIEDEDTDSISIKIKQLGDKIREMKLQKADSETVKKEVKTLLDLKNQYQNLTGKTWEPNANTKKQTSVTSADKTNESKMVEEPNIKAPGEEDINELTSSIERQGNKVRGMKNVGLAKEEVDKEVTLLLSLKAKYKQITGNDWGQKGKSKPDKKVKGTKKMPTKLAEVKVEEVPKTGPELKKITRLGLEVRKEENLSEWYSQVITRAQLIDYYDVSGCYILRPWAYSIWERIAAYFDLAIKTMGVQNCYFPMFVSHSALEREKTHIADFAPEVAWVTKSGQTDLAEPIAIRPTSETVMYPSYSKWIKSHRDLPLRLNQWCNIVRWEFKHPQPFLRTREFLWQEGHSAFATYDEAVKEVYEILDLYAEVYEKLLAIPVIKGRKTEKEKFAGGDFTTTCEAYIAASGRGIQGATSHHLGQNFSKMFEIVFEDPETQEPHFVHQNSWGLTTRTIGVMVMVHGDNTGLILPPKVASIQVVIVPCGFTKTLSPADHEALLRACASVEKSLSKSEIRVKTDLRDNYSPGWKFNDWELKGVPLRMEIGPRDVINNQVVLARRDNLEKMTVKMDGVVKTVTSLLDAIQSSLYEKAKQDLKRNMVVVQTWDDLCAALNNSKLIQAPFCGEISCEDNIKADSAKDVVVEEGAPSMGAKGLCIPFEPLAELQPNTQCVHPQCKKTARYYTMFGRSY